MPDLPKDLRHFHIKPTKGDQKSNSVWMTEEAKDESPAHFITETSNPPDDPIEGEDTPKSEKSSKKKKRDDSSRKSTKSKSRRKTKTKPIKPEELKTEETNESGKIDENEKSGETEENEDIIEKSMREDKTTRDRRSVFSKSRSLSNLKKGLTPKQLAEKEQQRNKSRRQTETEKPLKNQLSKSEISEKKKKEKIINQEEKLLIEEESKHREIIIRNASDIAGFAEKLLKTKTEEIKLDRRIAGSLLQFSQQIKSSDDHSLLVSVLSYSADYVDISAELFASLLRNLEKRITVPSRQLSFDLKERTLTRSDVQCSINSLISFAEVYMNFFKVGLQNLSKSYDQLMEFQSVVSFNDNTKSKPNYEKGQKYNFPTKNVSLWGFLQKKGALRHSWKTRWFILEYNTLYYFNNDKELLLKGFISLENSTIQPTQSRKFPHCFTVTVPNHRAYLISADSVEFQKIWIEKISAAAIYRPLGVSLQQNRSTIVLVDPLEHLSSSNSANNSPVNQQSSKSYKVPNSIEEFIRSDQYSRHWRDFRAKEPAMIQWVLQRERLLELLFFALQYIPDPTPEEIAAAAAEQNKNLIGGNQTKKSNTLVKRTLSSLSGRIKSSSASSGGNQGDSPSSSPSKHRSLSITHAAGGSPREQAGNTTSQKLVNNAILIEHANTAKSVLLTSEKIVTAAVQTKGFFQQLFDFLLEKSPIQLRRFYYFFEILQFILYHKSAEVFEYLAENQHYLDRFIIHIDNEFCLRLILSFWSYNHCKDKVIVLNQLGIYALDYFLLPQLPPSFHIDDTEHVYENLMIFIRELVRRYRFLNLRPETVVMFNKLRDGNVDTDIRLEDHIDQLPLYSTPSPSSSSSSSSSSSKRTKKSPDSPPTSSPISISCDGAPPTPPIFCAGDLPPSSVCIPSDNASTSPEPSSSSLQADPPTSQDPPSADSATESAKDKELPHETPSTGPQSTNPVEQAATENSPTVAPETLTGTTDEAPKEPSTPPITSETIHSAEKQETKEAKEPENAVNTSETKKDTKTDSGNRRESLLMLLETMDEGSGGEEEEEDGEGDEKEEDTESKESELNAEEVFNTVRARRNSEVRRDWVDVAPIWSMQEEYEEENEQEGEDQDAGSQENPSGSETDTENKVENQVSEGNESEEGEHKSNAPNKPLPSVPPRKNQELINRRAPGYLESKQAPFMTNLKNLGKIRIIITSGLKENSPTSRGHLEILISMLKISRSKESDQQFDDFVDSTDKTQSINPSNSTEIVQKAPHVVVTELVSQFSKINLLLKLNTNSNGTLLPLGQFKYNLIRLVRYLIDCGFKFVDSNLIQTKLIGKCLDIMFAFPNHSILHSTMEELLNIVFTRQVHKELAIYLIKKYHLPKKFIRFIEQGKEKNIHYSLNAQIMSISNTISSNRSLRKLLIKNNSWVEFLANEVVPVMRDQYVDTSSIPAVTDNVKYQAEAEKWKKRWEEFNFLISV